MDIDMKDTINYLFIFNSMAVLLYFMRSQHRSSAKQYAPYVLDTSKFSRMFNWLIGRLTDPHLFFICPCCFPPVSAQAESTGG